MVGDATKAASTDIDGKFSLKGVKVSSSIIVSYIGYNDKTVVWNGQHLDIKLSEAANTLDEVVVLGYTVQTKESLTGPHKHQGHKTQGRDHPQPRQHAQRQGFGRICSPR